MPLRCLDFFAGGGLATEGLKTGFNTVWANDNCPRKHAVYSKNHPDHEFYLGGIEEVAGSGLPPVALSWASFPCQDLSLAGKMGGIDAARSGLVWHWLRVMDEMPARPPIVVAENVQGLLTAARGEHYRILHRALEKRGYRVGALILDAIHWLPQSRPRVFVVGVSNEINTEGFEQRDEWCHWPSVVNASRGLDSWVWWRLPKPSARRKSLSELLDMTATVDDPRKSAHNVSLIPPAHMERIQESRKSGLFVFPGYKRSRNNRQQLELRFDDVAGCLRTPGGGSSKQHLVIANGHGMQTRLLTVREAARLMGARESYKIPGSYNDGYKAMGDAVAVPVVRHLVRHLLAPLAERAVNGDSRNG